MIVGVDWSVNPEGLALIRADAGIAARARCGMAHQRFTDACACKTAPRRAVPRVSSTSPAPENPAGRRLVTRLASRALRSSGWFSCAALDEQDPRASTCQPGLLLAGVPLRNPARGRST